MDNTIITAALVYEKLEAIREKIDRLPEEMRDELQLECDIYEDYFKDKYLRPTYRRKNLMEKKIGITASADL
jgi:hypothetical protein